MDIEGRKTDFFAIFCIHVLLGQFEVQILLVYIKKKHFKVHVYN